MSSLERKVLGWLEKNIFWVGLLGVTLISMLIRLRFRHFISGDAKVCLIPWYHQIKEYGFHSLGGQTGDYNILYQFLIAVMGYIPISPLSAYKLLSIPFDYLLATGVGALVYLIRDKKREFFLAGYTITILLPTVLLNSSCWAQCDAIYTAFIVLAFIALFQEKTLWMFVFYGLAFCFKFQSIFLLPFFLLLYFTRKKFSILYFLVIPLEMIITSIPGFLFGRKISDVFTIYFNQTGTYNKIQMNYPSFWCIVTDPTLEVGDTADMIKAVAIIFTVGILLALFVYWIKTDVKQSFQNAIYMAFLSAYTCVLFFPTMHERYGFVYEILGIIILFYCRKTIIPYIALISLTLLTYGNYLFGLKFPINYSAGLANIAIYVAYMILLNREIQKETVLSKE